MDLGVSAGDLNFGNVGFHIVYENGVTPLVMDPPKTFPDIRMYSRAMGSVVFPFFEAIQNPLAVAMVN